jgi:Flp pilus assembly protein TadG
MVTAELAVGLPVLTLLLAVAVSAVSVAGVRSRTQDAARELARAAARGDPAAGRRLAAELAPGARLSVVRRGDEIVASVHRTVHLVASWLPAVSVDEQAVAAWEPSSAAGSSAAVSSAAGSDAAGLDTAGAGAAGTDTTDSAGPSP